MTSIIGTLKLKANNTMKILNQLIPFLSGVLVLTACSSEVANANIDVAEADTVAAQNEVISKAQLELPFVGKKFLSRLPFLIIFSFNVKISLIGKILWSLTNISCL